MVVALAIPFILSNHQAASYARLLPAEVAKLRALGVPVTPEELPHSVQPLDKQNAANLYEELFHELAIFRNTSTWKSADQAAVSATNRGKAPSNHPLVRQWIAQHGPFFDKADRISDYRGLNFNRDYRLGMGLQLSEVGYMRDLARWQSYRATLATRTGDSRRALEAVESIFALSRQASQDNAIIQLSNACAIDELAHGALKEFILAFQSEPTQLAKARMMLEGISDHIDMRGGLYAELVLGRATIRDLRDTRDIGYSTTRGGATPASSMPQFLHKYSMRNSNVRAMFDYKYLNLWARAFERMPKDAHDWKGMRDVLDLMEQEIRSAKAPEDVLNVWMFPSLKGHATSCGLVQTRHRLALLSLRILESPQGPPSDLGQFNSLAEDPMDGKPMRYFRSGRAFKIWSAGANEVDDKGAESVAGNPSKNVDLVYRFGLPPLAPPPATTSTPIRTGGSTP